MAVEMVRKTGKMRQQLPPWLLEQSTQVSVDIQGSVELNALMRTGVGCSRGVPEPGGGAHLNPGTQDAEAGDL